MIESGASSLRTSVSAATVLVLTLGLCATTAALAEPAVIAQTPPPPTEIIPPEPDEPIEPDDMVLDVMPVATNAAISRADDEWETAQEAEDQQVERWVGAEKNRRDLWGLKTIADVTVNDAKEKLDAAQRVTDREAAELRRLRGIEADRSGELDGHRADLRRVAAAIYAASPDKDPMALGTFDQMSIGSRREAAISKVVDDHSNLVSRAQRRWQDAKDVADEQAAVHRRAAAARDEAAEVHAGFVTIRDGYLRLHDSAQKTVHERTVDLQEARLATAEEREDRRAARLVAVVPPLGFPLVALHSYWEASANAPCHVPWWLLAGVGRVESGHGTAHGSGLDERGDTTRRILGIPLDGTRNTMAISDTDGGQLDSDGTWDRAVGPMQFIPGTWRRWASDGNDDGTSDPHNMYDATAAAARYLCNVRGDVTGDNEARVALLAYNRSNPYGLLVLDQGHRYRDSVDLPDVRPEPEPTDDTPTGD